MSASYAYAQAKATLISLGYSMSSGSGWTASDQAHFEQAVKSDAWKHGGVSDYQANYGFAYSVAPTWLTNFVSSGTP